MISLVFAMLLVIAVLCTSPAGSSGESPNSGLLTVAQVCERVPGARGARRLHPATVTRWILHGCPSRTGVRIKLTAVRVGGRWLVREADLDAFFAALAVTDHAAPMPTPSRDTDQRRRASERAARELKRRGA